MIPVEALHAGDRVLFRELIEKYGGLVRSYVRAYASDPDELDDLFQEVWIKVWVSRERFRGGSWARWLIAVTRNHCVTSKRSKEARVARMERIAQQTEEDQHVWRAVDAQERLETEETKGLVQRALGSLTEREQEAISLRILEGRPPEEVARMMKCTKATVRSLIRRGINRLHEFKEVGVLEELNGANGG